MVKTIRLALTFSLIALILSVVGCGNGDMNNDANAEKNKEQGAVDKRADAVGKMSDQAANAGSK